MTKPEITGSRKGDLRIIRWFKEKFPDIEVDEKSEDLRFSRWIRDEDGLRGLPDSEEAGLVATDLDIIPANCITEQVMLVETKTKNASITRPQREMFNNLHHWIQKGIKNTGWNYLGFHRLKFEKKFFDDGKCFWDKEEITEEKLVKQFSWIRMITHLNFVLSNYKTKKIMLLKVMTHNADFTSLQRELFRNLNYWIKKGIKGSGWEYLGFHRIKFENSFFDDGKCIIDKEEEITEKELIELFWKLLG